jgi:hypothetical protein
MSRGAPYPPNTFTGDHSGKVGDVPAVVEIEVVLPESIKQDGL